jgi:glycosidase
MNCFNFATSQAEGVMAAAAKGFAISKYTSYIASLQSKVAGKNPDSMLMPFLSNHDMDRIAGSFVTENNMRMAANLYLLSPGSPVIYYGEEIGMRGSRGGENTDANRRLAMLWGDEDMIRDPIGSTYPEKNQIKTTVAEQLNDENSMLRYYCKLLTIRHKYPAIARGQYTALNGEKNLGGFRIAYEGETFGLLHNNSTSEISYDLSQFKDCNFTAILDYIGVGSAKLEGTTLTLGPQTSVILK